MTKQTSDSDGPCFQLCHGIPGFLISRSSRVWELFEIYEVFIVFLCCHKKPCIYLNSTSIKVLRYVVCFTFQAPRFRENEEENAMQRDFTNDAIQIWVELACMVTYWIGRNYFAWHNDSIAGKVPQKHTTNTTFKIAQLFYLDEISINRVITVMNKPEKSWIWVRNLNCLEKVMNFNNLGGKSWKVMIFLWKHACPNNKICKIC